MVCTVNYYQSKSLFFYRERERQTVRQTNREGDRQRGRQRDKERQADRGRESMNVRVNMSHGYISISYRANTLKHA